MEGRAKGYRLFSIRNRILVFAVLITVVPSLGIGWFMGQMMHDTVTEKYEQKLWHTANLVKRELDLWLKERNYDLYVFSNSQIISKNYQDYLHSISTSEESSSDLFLSTLGSYLTTVNSQFEEYAALHIFNSDGSLLVTSHAENTRSLEQLPPGLLNQLEEEKYVFGQVSYSLDGQAPLLLIATSIQSEQSGKPVGIMALEVKLTGLGNILKSAMHAISWDMQVQASLINVQDEKQFISTNPEESGDPTTFSTQEMLQGGEEKQGIQEFVNTHGEEMIGILSLHRQLGWGVLVAERYDHAFLKVTTSNRKNLLAVCFLTICIGILASLLARQIIVPMNALANGAQRIAQGDLEFQLSAKGNDELGFAINVFNEMITQLRQSQNKLEQLATTDALTNLSNRKQIMKLLVGQLEYYRRYGTEFSVLMVDVDHFKAINDTYGHLAGDAVLQELGGIFSETLRNVDSAGRYGGEEFLVILAESNQEDCWQVAERIRKKVSSQEFSLVNSTTRVTVSIGATKISPRDRDENDIVNRSDIALYRAKNGGRNKTVYLEDNPPRSDK